MKPTENTANQLYGILALPDFKAGAMEAIKDAEMIAERIQSGALTVPSAIEYIDRVINNAGRNMEFAPDFQRGYITTFKGIFIPD